MLKRTYSSHASPGTSTGGITKSGSDSQQDSKLTARESTGGITQIVSDTQRKLKTAPVTPTAAGITKHKSDSQLASFGSHAASVSVSALFLTSR